MMLYFFILGTLSIVVSNNGMMSWVMGAKRHELGVVCDTLPTQRPLHLAVGTNDSSNEMRIADFKLLG